MQPQDLEETIWSWPKASNKRKKVPGGFKENKVEQRRVSTMYCAFYYFVNIYDGFYVIG